MQLDNRSQATERIIQYCGPYNASRAKLIVAIYIFSVIVLSVFFAPALSDIMQTLGLQKVTSNVLSWVIVPLIISLLLGYIFASMNSHLKTRKRLRKYRRQGILDELVYDFERSEPKYDDCLRLGNKAIFGRETGELAPLSGIAKVRRVEYKHYHDGVLKEIEYYIEVNYRRRPGTETLCYISAADVYDEFKWKAFAEELRWRNNDIFIEHKLKHRVSRTSSSDGD